jgi:hypothetical protein
MRRADAPAKAPSSAAAAPPPRRPARHASEKGQTGEVLLVQDKARFKPGLARGLPCGYSLTRPLRLAELGVPLLPACLLTKDLPKGLQDPLIEPKVSVHKRRLVRARQNPVFFLLLFPARPPVEKVRERALGVARGLNDTRRAGAAAAAEAKAAASRCRPLTRRGPPVMTQSNSRGRSRVSRAANNAAVHPVGGGVMPYFLRSLRTRSSVSLVCSSRERVS